jgi:pimeloyl-ACP methyl ester carboxylesterase
MTIHRHAGLIVCIILLALGEARLQAAGRPVVLQSGDGTPLAGTLFEASNRPAPAVVLVHMLGRSKDEWTVFAEQAQSAGLTVLALDLRGHGTSGGASTALPPMVGDVRAAINWLVARPTILRGSIAVVGASLGANLAALAAADTSIVRGVALLSPSLDYRGVRLDAATMKKLSDRLVWLGASTEDPYALRTVRELTTGAGSREQYLSGVRGHGTQILTGDAEASRALLDWLKRALIP